MRLRIPLALFAPAIVAGCATSPPPLEQLAASEAAIAIALNAGAAELAPLELQSAHQKLQLTRRWIGARDHEPARWLAEQAQVDAELAAAKALANRAQGLQAR